MSTEPINYEALIADIENKIAHLQATLAGVKALASMNGLGLNPTPTNPGGGGHHSAPHIAHDAFLGKSIPEAAVTVLTGVRKKLSTQALMEAMESGGLPHSKYNTVYSILRRRENQVGDIINFQGEWALAAWHPNHSKAKKRVSLNSKTFESVEDDGPDEDQDYEAARDSAAEDEAEQHARQA